MKTKELFYQIPTEIIEDTALNITEKLVFTLLMDRKRINMAYNIGSYADVSNNDIKSKLNISRKQISLAISHLKKSGYITNTETIMYQSNRYYLKDMDSKCYCKLFKCLFDDDNNLTLHEKYYYTLLYNLYENRLKKKRESAGNNYFDNSINISNAELIKLFGLKTHQGMKKIINRLFNKGIIETIENVSGNNSVKAYTIIHPEHMHTCGAFAVTQRLFNQALENTADTVSSAVGVVADETVTKVNETIETVKESIKHGAKRLNENINSTVSAVVNSSTLAFDEVEFNKNMEYFRQKTKETDNLYSNKYLNGLKWS